MVISVSPPSHKLFLITFGYILIIRKRFVKRSFAAAVLLSAYLELV